MLQLSNYPHYVTKRKQDSPSRDLVASELIEQKICFLRGHRIMLDMDLAEIYGVSTKRLNEQVKRNLDRFPNDFMFQLTLEEAGRFWLQGRKLRP